MIIGGLPNAFSQQYFQQEVNYTIDVRLNDKLHQLSAFEKIEYTNNSPDTLRFLYFHLWPNAYSNNTTDLAKQIFKREGRTRLFNNPDLRGFIDSLDFRVDGRPATWMLLPNQPDICQLLLNEPLLPGKSTLITTPFRVKLPKGITSRMGHINDSYQISQWYPKPAVYDRDGWHPMPYLDQGEFYAEFGSFDVSITLPDNYVVGATGNLRSEEELKWLEELAADTAWMSNKKATINRIPVSSTKMKTLRYTEKNVHDFAWFADKRFHVLKSKVTLPHSGRTVHTWLMFTNVDAKFWKEAVPFINRVIRDMSDWIGEYPFNNFTALQSSLTAGAGMEYPGITVIGHVRDAYSLDRVIAHEAIHNWLYGALATNERAYPYMDEGMTSFYETRYLKKNYPDRKMWEDFLPKLKQAKFLQIEDIPMERMNELLWLTFARNNLEQPIHLAAPDFTEANYALTIYVKAALGFNYLKAYLGDSVFDATIQEYFRRWEYKHPQPDDLRTVFESNTEKDVSWFFNDYIATTKRLDYSLVRLKDGKLLLENKGELVAPLVIAGMKGDSICFEQWVDGFEGQQWIDVPAGEYTELKIDPNHVMTELYRLNNNIRTSGIFPKADPIQPQLLMSIENPDKRSLMYIPAINWNRENGFMIGMAFHNGIVMTKPFQYFIVPFYTFSNSSLAGYGRFSYNLMPYNKLIRLAQFSLEGTRLGAPGSNSYHKLSTGVSVSLRPDKETHSILQNIYGKYTLASDLFQVLMPVKAAMKSFVQLGYTLQNIRKVNPYSLSVNLESGDSYQKVAVNYNYKLSYNEKGNGLETNLFAGSMLNNTPTNSFYALAPSGRTGREQYLYDGLYPDRFGVYPTSFFSRQMALSEGGLVSYVNDQLGYSNWLVSLSISSSLLGKLGQAGIKPFVNLVLNDHGLASNYSSPFFGEAGVKVGIWNLFEIHIPLVVTSNIQSIKPTIADRIRIVINLDLSKLNNRF